ncbi:MAG: hypothetical protein M9962_07760 [Oligoflexia bacterium]|nr:hypothetical protein [Oligoflexia bacterium]
MEKKARVSTGLPWYAYGIIDFLGIFLSLGPGIVAWSIALTYLHSIWTFSAAKFFLYSLLAPFLLIFSFIFVLWALRLFIPKQKRGVYPMGINKGTLTWFCHLGLSRSSIIAGISPLLNAFYLTKYLHWRALGMKIAYGVNTSIGVSFVDLSMITIGKGSTVSEGVHIACHTFVGDRLFVSPVEIGENVFIGMNCILGPKTKIGAGAWVGMGNLISENITEGSKLDNFKWEHGNPERSAK